MKLSEFIASEGMSQGDLAYALGVSSATVSRWVSGKRSPSAPRIRKIKELTKGRVSADDLLSDAAA